MITYYPDIGNAIRERRKNAGIRLFGGTTYQSHSPSAFLIDMADILGKNPPATYDTIHLIERGDIYGTTSIKGVNLNRNKHLHELSAYLQALGYEETDPLIKEIRNADPLFIYPPQD